MVVVGVCVCPVLTLCAFFYSMEVQYQRLIIEAVEVGLPFNTVTEVVNNMREKRVAPDLAVLMDNLKAQENSSRDQSE